LVVTACENQRVKSSFDRAIGAIALLAVIFPVVAKHERGLEIEVLDDSKIDSVLFEVRSALSLVPDVLAGRRRAVYCSYNMGGASTVL
jgi:hypothetical protein